VSHIFYVLCLCWCWRNVVQKMYFLWYFEIMTVYCWRCICGYIYTWELWPMACEKHCRSPRYLSGLLAKIHTSRYRSNVHIGRSETYRHQVVDVAKYWVEIGRSNHAAYLVTGTVEVLAPTNYQVLVLVLNLYWRLWTQATAFMSTSLWRTLNHLNHLIFTILINSCQVIKSN